MKRLTPVGALLLLLTLALLPESAQAQWPHTFHCSGTGIFSPTNIGRPRGGNAGIVIGDGTGASEYTASGTVFTIGGENVGTGANSHQGGNLSFTTGILNRKKTKVRWPAVSNTNHVLTSDQGTIEFKYFGEYNFELNTGQFTADALFFIVKGTGRFEGAQGLVSVDVSVPIQITELPPPGVSPAIPFEYNFKGLIWLDD